MGYCNRRPGVCLALVFLATGALSARAGELGVSDFKLDGPLGSNNSVITRVGKNHFKIALGDQPGVPHQAAFVYFIITGNARGNTLRLDVDPGKGRNGSYREYFHSWSYDGKNWNPIRWKGRGFTFPKFTRDVVYVGNQVPMSYENLVEMVGRWKKSPFVSVKIVGKSHEKRNLYRLDTDNLVNPMTRKEGGARTKWSTGPHDQFGITAFLCEGSGGIHTKAGNLQSGAVIIKALDRYYKGTRARPAAR